MIPIKPLFALLLLFLAACRGGEMHVYALRVEGPEGVIALQALNPANRLLPGPDGRFYLAGSTGPDARISTFLTAPAAGKEGVKGSVPSFVVFAGNHRQRPWFIGVRSPQVEKLK